jgi:Ras-related protein Rab-2A
MSAEPLFKFIIIGDSGMDNSINQGVGKSCLLMRYMKDAFSTEYNVTIGVEFLSKVVEVDQNTKVKL